MTNIMLPIVLMATITHFTTYFFHVAFSVADEQGRASTAGNTWGGERVRENKKNRVALISGDQVLLQGIGEGKIIRTAGGGASSGGSPRRDSNFSLLSN